MTLAVVISPVPSAPIALASGMVYGNVWGTIFVVIGAEGGALIAFGIARLAGYEFLKKWIGNKVKSARILGSQTVMMTIVFFSRLLPFISFDIVSYAAGLTPLTFWRFAIATLAGIIPMSFLLSHIGQEAGTGEPRAIFLSSIIIGLLVLLPIVGRMIYQHKRK
ncbi:MAG: VTT domain-containing protein [Pelovirga sp.]